MLAHHPALGPCFAPLFFVLFSAGSFPVGVCSQVLRAAANIQRAGEPPPHRVAAGQGVYGKVSACTPCIVFGPPPSHSHTHTPGWNARVFYAGRASLFCVRHVCSHPAIPHTPRSCSHNSRCTNVTAAPQRIRIHAQTRAHGHARTQTHACPAHGTSARSTRAACHTPCNMRRGHPTVTLITRSL